MFTNKSKLILQIIAAFGLIAIIYFFVTKKSAAESNRDEITVTLTDIAANAQTHYKRTNSFNGWAIPASLRIEDVGTFREQVENDKVIIYVVGIEVGENGVSNINVKCVITGNNTTIKIRN